MLAAGGGEVAEVVFALRVRFPAGEAEAAAAGLAATGEGEVVGVAFDLRVRFPAGEGDAAAAAAGEAAVVASAFLCARCFAGDGDAAGDPSGVGD